MIARLLVVLLSGLAMATATAEDAAWPGGIARIDLGPATGEQPTATYDDRRVLVANVDGRWQAVVGVHLDAPEETAAIRLSDGTKYSFEVVSHAYREQHLEVAPGYVSLSDENLARVGEERKIIDAALNNWQDADLDGVDLKKPVDGPHSSSFGSRRFFNGEARSPHSGMDIAANSGVPILAPRSGVVAATGDYYFNGNTVIIDHGQGLVTMYCHLSKIDVQKGQVIELDEQLGLVGATGRVTGAHLHFGTYLNGNAVDPELLLEALAD
jgi:murein DD-endopeptidase MepM/ murein hydrolase activator NlpD